ncbi:MAG TPA: Hsp20/alpha crystallin family protein [Acidimicrobiales bacterium]|nr:Hsp20/alpha crystallin family protein [Acidimicrobiales bacterium]
MTLVRRDWLNLELPERWRRMLDMETDFGRWMRVEEFREGDTLVVRAEAPGLDPEHDVELTVTGDVLEIRAHREEREEKKGKASYRSEFRYGAFERTVPLPAGVGADDVKASYKDGILEIRIPVPAELKSETTKVPVTRG